MVVLLSQLVAQQINVKHVELVVSKLHVYQLPKDRFKKYFRKLFLYIRPLQNGTLSSQERALSDDLFCGFLKT